MHKLESPHTLKFHDWYETRNNLWLIVEFCAGADLETLLKQDGHLPEASVRMFGLDMLAGLKYMHLQGMLHCDLRPRNFLIDEYGILKISDFKMTRKIPKATLGDMPLEQRGTLPYMAPELFGPEGVHSFCSDFWALGCVLYELRRGAPPYGNCNMPLSQLLEHINNLNPIDHPLMPNANNERAAAVAEPSKEAKGHAPSSSDRIAPQDTAAGSSTSIPSMTAKLADLLLWLMEKRPMHRCSWGKVSVHPFWGPNSNPVPSGLPAEPAFDALVKNMEHCHSLQVEAAALAEYGIHASLDPDSDSGAHAIAGLGHAVSAGVGIPHTSDSTPVRPPAKTGMEQVTATKLTEGRLMESHKEADSKEGNIAGALSSITGHKADGKVAASEVDSKGGRDAREREDGTTKDTPETERLERTDRGDGADPLSVTARQSRPVSQGSSILANTSNLNAHDTTNMVNAINLQTLSNGITQRDLTAEKLLLHSSDTQVKPIVGNKSIEAVERLPFRSSALPFPYLDTSDITKLSAFELEAHLTLIYKALQKANAEAAKTTKDTLLSERSQMLAYLCALAPSAEVANIVLNTNFLQLLLRLIRTTDGKSGSSTTAAATSAGSTLSRSGSASSSRLAHVVASPASVALRVTAATVLATMLRYATFIQPPSAKNKDEHILPVLVAILKDPQRLDAKLKKRAVAGLGETIFYVSSQEGEGSTDKWNVPAGAFSVLVKCLRDDTDEIVRHYAAKTIENIMAQGCLEFRRRLATIEVASRLLELSQKGGNDAFQATCGMALSHMLFLVMTSSSGSSALLPRSAERERDARETQGPGTPRTHGSQRGVSSPSPQSPSSTEMSGPGVGVAFVSRVLSKGGLPALLETLHDGQPKLQQAYLNIISVLFVSASKMAMAHGPGSAAANVKDNLNSSLDENNTSYSSTAGERPPASSTADSALRSTRLFFLKAPTLVPSLLRLIEQGASSAVRAKAIILAQLLCAHQPSLLATLGERRLPSALVRLLEPLVVSQRISRDAAASAYPSSAALCIIKFIRGFCVTTARALVVQLASLSSPLSSSLNVARVEGRPVTPESSPDKRGRIPSSGVRQSPTPSRQKAPSPVPLQGEVLDLTRLALQGRSIKANTCRSSVQLYAFASMIYTHTSIDAFIHSSFRKCTNY